VPTTVNHLRDVLILECKMHRDSRGAFAETWHEVRYREAGIPSRFVQDNVSWSSQGVLRGLHYQWPHPQGKLISVLSGEVFDVAVDLRVGSPSFGKWAGYTLSHDGGRQVYVPPGFAHGFVVLSEQAIFSYKCTELYRPDAERLLRWDDEDLAIEWPVGDVHLSDRDNHAPRLRDVPRHHLPAYAAAR